MVSRQRKFFLWWRRTGMGIRALLLCACFFALGVLAYLRIPEDDAVRQGSNLLVLGLVNLNILLLCILAFLIGRNVVKLIFDRRRNILGSRLRMRLVVAFVALTLLPSIILFVMARGLLSNAIQGWFSSQVERSVNGAVSIARHHFAHLKDGTLARAQSVAQTLNNSHFERKTAADQRAALEELRERNRLYSLKLVDGDDHMRLQVAHVTADIESFEEPALDREGVRKARAGEPLALLEERGASHFVRAYVPLSRKISADAGTILIAALRVDPAFSHDMDLVTESYKEYEQLKRYRNPIRSGYILTLAMITGLTIFSAVWIGFFLARQIAVPIQRLAEGMGAVSRGNYDVHVRSGGDDEMGFLVKSFNKMTADLKTSRADAERRRLYIETILSRLAVGVIRLDTGRVVTSINPAAARIFAIDDAKEALGKSVGDVVPQEALAQIGPLLDLAGGDSQQTGLERAAQVELRIPSQGRELKIVCTAGRIGDSDSKWLGTVLLFDDVTELSKAQHMAAWRDVAQRIAHEIKNPLTPIQLSAQRLAKILGEGGSSDSSVNECVQTIVEHVDSIKRLANEFSHFARMPTAEFKGVNLNNLLSDAIVPFAESHEDIVFQFIGDSSMPEVVCDGEQVRRVMINLVDNAIAAVSGDKFFSAGKAAAGARIVIRTSFDRRRRVVSIEVADNGPGVGNSDKSRIFAPYFTTKTKGTGLGLAIVSSIIAEHHGDIRVLDNKPRGARFIVELPMSQVKVTQRRLVVG